MMPRGDHVLVMGNVLAAYAEKEAFKGLYDLKRFKPLLHLGNDVFTTTSTETIEPELDQETSVPKVTLAPDFRAIC